jgi:hypothetical protein
MEGFSAFACLDIWADEGRFVLVSGRSMRSFKRLKYLIFK